MKALASMCGRVVSVCVPVAFGVAAFSASAWADGRAEWLDVRSFGASGSKFETKGSTTAGSRQISVEDVGDFKVGQGVMVSDCNPRYIKQELWGPRGVVLPVIGRDYPLGDKGAIRGYDGTQGEWLVLILDVPQGSTTFRCSEDIARTWQPATPITGEWQSLRDGIEVRFNEHDWKKGYTVVFVARSLLVTAIEKIEGNVITVQDAPTRTVKDAVVRHCDDRALQAAIDRAIQTNHNVYVPSGHYRLSQGLRVADAEGITIEGQSGVGTVLDISEGEGACVTMSEGKEVTLRNFTMVGHSGFDRRDQCGFIRMRGSSYFWGFAAKDCNATTINGTQRVLIENCHGRRMAAECFVSLCRDRGSCKPVRSCCKRTTYLRCSAINCGRNGFNDVTCGPENTSVQYCRIVDVGGAAWEGASRFVKFVGNYVRNSGTVALGNIAVKKNADESFPAVGSGQHVVANNVFESNVPYGVCAIRSAAGATQVIITNNQFVNFGSSAVEVWGRSTPTHYSSANTTVTGNIFDMTEIGDKSISRIAVETSASDTIIADNQVYVRGEHDPEVTAIKINEPAVNVSVHNNLIRNCGRGVVTRLAITGRARPRVGEVVDPVTFVPYWTDVPLDHRRTRQCEGWRVVWLADGKPAGESVLDAVIGAAKPETVRFKLRQPREMKVGESFDVIPPTANWSVHDNTITDCLQPVALDSYGSDTSFFRDNIVTRGEATGVKQAVAVSGRFNLIGNHISGFDEKDSAALMLNPDALGKTCPNLYRNNIFQRCSVVVKESREGLWKASTTDGNLFIDCDSPPELRHK